MDSTSAPAPPRRRRWLLLEIAVVVLVLVVLVGLLIPFPMGRGGIVFCPHCLETATRETRFGRETRLDPDRNALWRLRQQYGDSTACKHEWNWADYHGINIFGQACSTGHDGLTCAVAYALRQCSELALLEEQGLANERGLVLEIAEQFRQQEDFQQLCWLIDSLGAIDNADALTKFVREKAAELGLTEPDSEEEKR